MRQGLYNIDQKAICNEYSSMFEETSLFPIPGAVSLPDWRMIVQIKMDRRYEIESEIQQVPFKIVRCLCYQVEFTHWSSLIQMFVKGFWRQNLSALAFLFYKTLFIRKI